MLKHLHHELLFQISWKMNRAQWLVIKMALVSDHGLTENQSMHWM